MALKSSFVSSFGKYLWLLVLNFKTLLSERKTLLVNILMLQRLLLLLF